MTGISEQLDPWIKGLLAEEQVVAPVAQFAYEAWHGLTVQERYYRNLIPLSTPKPGQQFAFEVDLDKCSGCKACVTACHRLNGLDDGEAWRTVGQLMSSEPSRGFVQTVTSACHHCLDPGCLTGCPVLAYEKDPITGIVRHLDDQCIGCQYCVLKCPYQVPQYHKELGIVRKCDMCHDRLSAGEAPACVQGCPNEAIQIRIVNQASIENEIHPESRLVPGAALSALTQPTTRYLSARDKNLELVPADEGGVVPENTHWPLVWMLLLTQASVGAWGFLSIAQPASNALSSEFLRASALVASAAACAGLLASVFHLGKPMRAWRACLGWRQSWLSREIIAFGGYAFSCVLAVIVPALAPPLLPFGLGTVAVGASVMVYADTGRPVWKLGTVSAGFLGTGVVLGGVIVLTTLLFTEPSLQTSHGRLGDGIAASVALVILAKMVHERTTLREREYASARALLQFQLAKIGRFRWMLGIMGAFALLLSLLPPLAAFPFANALICSALALVVMSELLERILFFRLAVAPSMPGGIRT